MIFHENRLLADDSHETSYLIFFRKLERMSHNLSSAAVVIGALRVNCALVALWLSVFCVSSLWCRGLVCGCGISCSYSLFFLRKASLKILNFEIK